MKSLSRILLPAALTCLTAAAALGFGKDPIKKLHVGTEQKGDSVSDTVIYPKDAYKLRRFGNLEDFVKADSLFGADESDDSLDFAPDSSKLVRARDTIKVPDSLRLTDPFRWKYYVAIVDSLTHVETRDSLQKSEKAFWEALDTLHARMDSTDWRRLDSLYCADSTDKAKAAFLAWYNSLDKKERKKYDYEQMVLVKMHINDSLRKIQADKKALKDSITENTPRILETYYLPDSMFYKRIICWTTDDEFHEMNVEIPDSSFNKWYNDYPFRRKDAGATWLGMAGSPVQTHNYFKRKNESGVDFIAANEEWTYSPKSLKFYNTKTPYTELAYWGTLFATSGKESDNVRIFTTQNITPGLNFQLLYERFGGEGMLQRENTNNKNFVFASDYVGKRYLLHTGFIHNKVIRQENGGIAYKDSKGNDGLYWIRDTTVDVREIPVNLSNSESTTKTNTIFLEQQYRIPFNFINSIKAKKDSTFKWNPDSLDRNITSALIGHSSEFSFYSRLFTGNSISDSLGYHKFDNKIFIRLQPWAQNAPVSKLNVGIGDRVNTFWLQDMTDKSLSRKEVENSVYAYAGVEGQFGKAVNWSAKGNLAFAGYNVGDFSIKADAGLSLHPFRKAKGSPLRISANFETALQEPDFYQRNMQSANFKWKNDFRKISTTKILGNVSIPHWKLEAGVGYSLIANAIYYDADAIVRQAESAVSIFNASLTKNFSLLGNILHLDNTLLFQLTSDDEVIPLPKFSANLRYYAELPLAKDRATKTRTVLTMQAGVNAIFNTRWYTPGWNPYVGVFYNQRLDEYTNGPILDAFINLQWKRACIFLKFENFGKGWPLKTKDYFSAARYINTVSSFKIGILWPFYLDTTPNPKAGGHQ